MKSYLLFAKLREDITYPSKSVAREKQITRASGLIPNPPHGTQGTPYNGNKRIYHCSIAFQDGFIIDYCKEGFFMGWLDYPGRYPFIIPVIEQEEEMPYDVIKGKDFTESERDALLVKLKRFYDYPGETDHDQIEQIHGREVKALKDMTRLTHSSLIAWIYDKEEYWLYDTDRLYEELGEWGRPGTLTEWNLEKLP